MTLTQSLPMMKRFAALALAGLLVSGCSDAVVPNYNNPNLGPVKSTAELQNRVTGILNGDRAGFAFQILIMEEMGRDAYRIDAADPRYLNNPFGQFDPSIFIANGLWSSYYRNIQSSRALLQAIDASPFTDEEKAGVRGYARTMEALAYMRLIASHDTTGLPVDTSFTALSPIRCKPAVLDAISAMLDSAATDLGNAGASFAFQLPADGWAGNGSFDNPAGFLEFNRALKAKNEIYRAYRDYAASATIDQTALTNALTAMDASFEDPDPAAFRNGVYHLYTPSSGDLAQPNFDNSVYRANPRVVAEADPGDTRLDAKVDQNGDVIGVPALNISSGDVWKIVQSPTAPLPIVLDVGLVLDRALILWGQGDYAGALALDNDVRTNDGGLAALTLGDVPTPSDLLHEILKQKRYSLLWESYDRAVDYRMFGLWSELGQEGNPPEDGPANVPIPEAEANARGGNLTCQ